MYLMDNNWTNRPQESEENGYSLPLDMKSLFIREFSKSYLAWIDKNRFIDDIMNKESIEDSDILKNKLKEFQAYSENVDLKSFDTSEINIYDLRRAVWKESLVLDNTRKNYLAKTFSDYSFSDKEKEKLEKKIKSIKTFDLEQIIKSDSENKNFLNKIFKKDFLKAAHFWSLLNLTEKEKETRFEGLSEEDKQVLKRIFAYSSTWYMTSDSVQNLFKTTYLKKEEKQEFIKIFIPYITLEEATNLNLLTIDEANKRKKTILKPILKDTKIEGNLIEDVIDSTALSDIKISTSEFFNDESSLDKIAENIGFSNLEKESDAVKDAIKENWPENFDQLILELEDLNKGIKESKFNHLDNFKEGNILKIEKKDEKWETVISHVKILNIDDDKKELSLLSVWDWDNVNLKLSWEGNTISYFEFFENFKSSTASFDFFTEKEIEEKIKNPSNSLNGSDLELFTEENLENTSPEQKEEYKAYYKEKLSEDIEILIKDLEGGWGEWKDSAIIKAKKEDLENIDWLENKELLEFLNLQKLIEKIDEEDLDWKFLWLKKGLVLDTKKWSHEIIWIGEGQIIIKSSVSGKNEELTFEQFYQAFKKNKANRVDKMNNFSELFESFKKEDNKYWKDFDFKDGKIIAKDVENGDEKGDQEVEYFVSDKDDSIIKISSVSWDKITVQFWERKSIDDLDEKDENYKKNDKGEVVYIEWAKKETFSLNEFKKILSDKKTAFKPNWQTGKQVKEKSAKNIQNEFKDSFSTRLFARYSISEVIAWWKMFVDGIMDSVKRWNNLHAANVALAMWTMLPEEIRADLQIKVERAEAEEMDKALDGLGKVDSPIAVKRIEWWLTNKDTAEYKKEAGLLFMLSKYGHLTSKGAMYPYRWKFLWYEAFWWRINDELFLEKKKEAADDDVTFSEEYLIHNLISKQCKWNWFAWYKRRSRLHKEVENKWKSGVGEEVEKWYSDAEKKRTAKTMISQGMWEASWWTTSNAIGWFKKAVERWDSLENMSEGFFSLLYSGALYNVDQATFLHIKKLWDTSGMPIVMARFSSTKSDMILFNKTVLELSNKIWDAYKDEFPEIKTDAKKLFDDAMSWKWKESDRLDNAQSFWKKYGTPLSRALNMADVEDTKYSKTDKILIFEKDSGGILWNYFNRVKEFTKEGPFNKDFMDDACWEVWLTWLDNLAIIKTHMKLWQNRSFYDQKTWYRMWQEIYWDIHSTKNKIFKWDSIDSEENNLAQRKYLLLKLRELFWWFRTNHSADTLKAYNDTIWIWKALKNWKIDMYTDFKDIDASDIINWSEESDEIIYRAIDNILSWKKHEEVKTFTPPSEIISNEIKQKISGITDE